MSINKEDIHLFAEEHLTYYEWDQKEQDHAEKLILTYLDWAEKKGLGLLWWQKGDYGS